MFEGLEDHGDRAMAYYGNDLSAEERVVFEAHLSACAECQALLATARAELPAAERFLSFKPLQSADAQAARFEAMVAAGRVKQRRRKIWWRVGLALATAVILVLGVAVYVVSHAPDDRGGPLYAPTPP